MRISMKLRVATVAVVFCGNCDHFFAYLFLSFIDRVRRNGDIVRQIRTRITELNHISFFVHYTPGGSPETAVPFEYDAVDKTHKQYPTEGQADQQALLK